VTLQQLLDRLAVALHSTTLLRDSQWAHDMCALSRSIHVEVWEIRPNLQYVRDRVLPLLQKTSKAVNAVPRTGEYGQLVGAFAENIAARANNIANNYLNGKPSDFLPNARLQDVPDKKITREELAAQPQGSV